MLNDGKLTRLIETEALAKNPGEAYTLGEMLADLRHGVFTEIYGSGPVKVDIYRRGLQRAYLRTSGTRSIRRRRRQPRADVAAVAVAVVEARRRRRTRARSRRCSAES